MCEAPLGDGRIPQDQAIAPAPPTMRGHIDHVDPTGLVSGWCASIDAPFGPRRVSILLDGVPVRRGVVCNLPRPDLRNAGIGDGRHGFETTLPHAVLQQGAIGQVGLCDEATGEAVGSVLDICWAPRDSSFLEAHIDQVSAAGIVSGWCWDRNDPARQIDLEILLNGAVCGTTRAGLAREDLTDLGKGSGRHGFVFALDTTRLAFQPTHSVGLREAGAEAQLGVCVTWHWPQAESVESRLIAMERKIEGLTGALATRNAAPPFVATSPAPGRARGQLRLVWLSGEMHTPGHVYRVVRMAEAAQALGHEARFLPVAEALRAIDELRGIDALFIWRAPLTPELRTVIDAVRVTGGAILFDIDDLMVEPALARPEIIDAIRSEGHRVPEVQRLYEGIRETAVLADATLVTTRELGIFVQALQKPVHVVPNGFDAATLRRSRQALRQQAMVPADGLLRIGYAGGSRTHQRDFGLVAESLARLLRRHKHCRLVLFRHARSGTNLVELHEYPGLAALMARVEWRDMVDLDHLPDEIARFDINLAPLETGNVFCEAKSELKFFEAALVGVPTIASPTGPFSRAIRDGESGLLAGSAAAWDSALSRLVLDVSLRRRMAQAAYHDALRLFGPERRQDILAEVLAQLTPGRQAAQAFELGLRRSMSPPPALPHVPVHEVVHGTDRGEDAQVSVMIPLYNYENHVKEALDSVWHQDLGLLDLIVIDDRSTDRSLQVVKDWAQHNQGRFNRMVVLQNLVNSGLGLTRNAGFAVAETPYVMPLDADNRLLPKCLSTCLNALRERGAAFAYPSIQHFGDMQQLVGAEPYWPARLGGGNFIDAMALVAKSAWASVGGYDHVRFGWEDYDFWCRMAEHGFWGTPIAEVLCEYRVHSQSMLRRMTDVKANKQKLIEDLELRHPWVNVARIHSAVAAVQQPVTRRGRRKSAAKAPAAKQQAGDSPALTRRPSPAQDAPT